MKKMTRHDEDLSRDPTVDTVCHLPDNRFVPVRLRRLVAAIASDRGRFGVLCDEVADLAEALEDVIEQEAGNYERFLAEEYSRFNPDRDTLPGDDRDGSGGALSAQAKTADLVRQLEYLFGKANFERLNYVQIEEAIRTAIRMV